MDDTRTRALVGECISRAAVEAARGATVGEIEQASDACDYERAATLAFGRVRGGETVPTAILAQIVPHIELPALTLALVAIVPERAALLELVERRRFPPSKDAGELETIVLYAAWRAGAEIARVIPELRRLSARAMSAEGYALLATIAQTIDDPHVATATKPIIAFAKERAKQVAEDEQLMTASIDKVIASLPAEIEMTKAAGFTVRSTKQVGRNDPCPCGSGLKYKKCCADKQVVPSPIAGLSYDEFLRGDKIAIEHVDQLPLQDLVRVDLTKPADPVLATIFRRFLRVREWRHAERALDELVRRKPDDDWRYELVHELFECGEVERARGHVVQMKEFRAQSDLELAIHDDAAAAWRALVVAAREALTSTDKLADVELAYTLLRAEPLVGIYFARACIGTLNADDPETLLDAVEDARDRLNLQPVDAAWSVLDELLEDEQKPAQADDAKLKDSLSESSARIDHLERTLAAVRADLEAARTRPVAELMRVPEDRDRATALDSKVRELEALIREGNAERRELRKQLQHTPPDERREGPRARRVTLAEPDDDVGDDIEVGARGIAIPRFDRRATDALASVPAAVGAEAMRTLGTLCAGDLGAWRGVKQAKDMTRPLLMARVGIHHRLLFRIDDGVLDVVDLITREQLLTTLKRLRATR